MVYYREWARSLTSRKGNMVTLAGIETLIKQGNPGYASCYMFNEKDAKEIRATGESKNLRRFSVASDCLIIDIDDGDIGLERVKESLDLRGLGYEVYFSGGKGYHVYIFHDLIDSEDLPFSHASIVRSWGLETDFTLYQHGRLLSLPGRLHPKTGQLKRFYFKVDGTMLQVPIVKQPSKPDFSQLEAKEGILTTGLMRAMNLTAMEPNPGNRHTAIWGTSKDLLEAGLEYGTVLDIMLRINEQWENPKDESEIEQAVIQAHGQLTT